MLNLELYNSDHLQPIKRANISKLELWKGRRRKLRGEDYDENYDYLPFGHLNKNSFLDVSQWVQPENVASPQVLESRSISKTCSLRFVLKFLSLLKSMIDKDHFKAARSGPSSPWADTVHQPTRGRCEKTIYFWSVKYLYNQLPIATKSTIIVSSGSPTH